MAAEPRPNSLAALGPLPGPLSVPALLLSSAAWLLAPLAATSAETPLIQEPSPSSTPSSSSILLDLSQREISLIRDGKAIGRWPVVIGAPETPTPVGHFQVKSKVVNPVYQSTSSGKVKGVGALGYRWIGFHSKGANDYGIHGTPWPWWVDARAAVSHGCVRMRNEHIDKLFAAVDLGTPVVIQP